MQFFPCCEREGDCEPGNACAGCEVAMNAEFNAVMRSELEVA